MFIDYLKAARLRTLPLSVSGILLGSFFAISENFFSWKIFLLTLLTAVGLQVLSNFANDYGDGIKGTDSKDRIGPRRLLQDKKVSPQKLLKIIKILTVCVLLLVCALLFISFGFDYLRNSLFFLLLGILSIIAAISYTMGKKPYGYLGLGDFFVFFFFGIVSVCGSYFLYAKAIQYKIFIPAMAIGLLSVAVLNLNNLRDYKSDKRALKNTLVVKMGIRFGILYQCFLIISPFILSIFYTIFFYKSIYQFIFIIVFFPLIKHLRFILKNKTPEKMNPELKKVSLSTFFYALLFGIGLLL